MPRILVVDQSEDMREALAVTLQLRGHDVEMAGHGAEALEKLATYHPQVVTTSVRLPGGMDGPALTRVIRQRRGLEVVIICLTGAGNPEVLRRALDAGCDQLLQKPVGLDVLEGAIRDGLARVDAMIDR